MQRANPENRCPVTALAGIGRLNALMLSGKLRKGWAKRDGYLRFGFFGLMASGIFGVLIGSRLMESDGGFLDLLAGCARSHVLAYGLRRRAKFQTETLPTIRAT